MLFRSVKSSAPASSSAPHFFNIGKIPFSVIPRLTGLRYPSDAIIACRKRNCKLFRSSGENFPIPGKKPGEKLVFVEERAPRTTLSFRESSALLTWESPSNYRRPIVIQTVLFCAVSRNPSVFYREMVSNREIATPVTSVTGSQ